jgi:RNA-directed DNA polymerase
VCVCDPFFMRKIHGLYHSIVSVENLFAAWGEFRKGKKEKQDVQEFERDLEDNLFDLHEQLVRKTYRHGGYSAFKIYDPKRREIHKAEVADRVVHHALVKILEPLFEPMFIFDSYSCRVGKGTHKAVQRLYGFIRKVSRNYTGNCFCLHLDIEKFFASVDHEMLLELIGQRVDDKDVLWLTENILKSFSSKIGMPIGNLTSQLFANVYLNRLDYFVKQRLGGKYYLRYADDFVIVTESSDECAQLIPLVNGFLHRNLHLKVHENKVCVRKYTQGIDFLGYVLLPRAVVLRTKTKRRILRKFEQRMENVRLGKVTGKSVYQSLQSYLGYLGHARAYRLSQELKNQSLGVEGLNMLG